jgi:hypothetical protein
MRGARSLRPMPATPDFAILMESVQPAPGCSLLPTFQRSIYLWSALITRNGTKNWRQENHALQCFYSYVRRTGLDDLRIYRVDYWHHSRYLTSPHTCALIAN